MTKRPNIVFLFGDQHRGQDLGCMGNDEVRTPSIDRLASQGAVARHCYANTPVCTPNRATLLTGLTPLTNRVVANDLRIDESLPSLAKTLTEHGYRCGYIGKWHLDGVPRDGFTPPGPRRHGFDGYWAAYNCTHDYFRPRYYLDGPDVVRVEGYEPEVQTDLAIDFLQADDDRPFCLFVSWGPPHDPYDQVPESYKSLYDAAKLTLRPNAEMTIPGLAGSTFDSRATLALYYAAITALDDQVGRVVKVLDESGLADNTLVVYSSDHGDMLGSQGLTQKQMPYEEAILVPLVVRLPGQVPSASEVTGLVSTLDIAPTLLGAVGAPPLAGAEGADRWPLLCGQSTSGADSVLLANYARTLESGLGGKGVWRGLRTERFTYGEQPGLQPWVLFDNEADPYQQHNLVGDADYDPVRDAMAVTLGEWLDATKDPFLDTEELMLDLGLAGAWAERQEYMTELRRRWLAWMASRKP